MDRHGTQHTARRKGRSEILVNLLFWNKVLKLRAPFGRPFNSPNLTLRVCITRQHRSEHMGSSIRHVLRARHCAGDLRHGWDLRHLTLLPELSDLSSLAVQLQLSAVALPMARLATTETIARALLRWHTFTLLRAEWHSLALAFAFRAFLRICFAFSFAISLAFAFAFEPINFHGCRP